MGIDGVPFSRPVIGPEAMAATHRVLTTVHDAGAVRDRSHRLIPEYGPAAGRVPAVAAPYADDY